MLQPFLQFGIVTDSVPFESIVSERKQTSAIVTSCHDCLVLRGSSNLAIWAKSDLLPGRIEAHASTFEWSFVSCGDCLVHCLHKQRRLDTSMTIKCEHERGNDRIRCLLTLGTSILLLGHQSGNLCVWDTTERLLLSSVQLDAPIKLLTHPCAYVNKVLITLDRDDDGDRIVLWNVKACTLLCQYEMRSKVNCVVQSPAIDVCAIGLDDGAVALLHLQKQQVLFFLSADHNQHSVTAIAFHQEKPLLLAGRRDGTIDLFDLEERRLVLSNTEESLGRLTKLDPVAGCVDLFTAAYERNALVQWTIDDKFQQQRRYLGNLEPVSKCHFLPDDCDKCVVACGHSVLIWNSPSGASHTFVANRRNYDSPVADVVCANRIASIFLMPEWADMVVVHAQSRRVSLARMDGKHEFRRNQAADHEKLPDWFEPAFQADDEIIPLSSCVLSCCISNCGNFAALGYSCGHVVVFNLQSREERLRLSIPNQPIRALAFDLLNRFLLFASEQGLIGVRPFRFKQQELHLADDKTLKAGVTGQFSAHRNGNLFAVPLADRSVSIVRVSVSQIEEVRNVVCGGPITFAGFSDDGRFLACSSLDSTLRLFDVASGSQLDSLRFEQPVVCFDFKDDLLVCACRGSLQLSVFACSFYYDQIKVPGEGSHQPSESLLTACLDQPACSTWRSLEKVEEILRNNRPEPALAKPKDAPFFLPAVPTLTGFKLITDAPNSTELDTVLKSTFIDSTELTKQLETADDTGALNQVFESLKKMNVIQLEFELGNLIRIACSEDAKNCDLFEKFISLLKTLLERRTDFDFVAAVTSRLAVKLCSEISDNAVLYRYIPHVSDLLSTAESVWKPIHHNYERSLCLIEFLKNDSI